MAADLCDHAITRTAAALHGIARLNRHTMTDDAMWRRVQHHDEVTDMNSTSDVTLWTERTYAFSGLHSITEVAHVGLV